MDSGRVLDVPQAIGSFGAVNLLWSPIQSIQSMNGGEMDRRSVENMKLDRRLIGRRGWISEKDLQRELSQLPDVADKAVSDDPDSEEQADIAAESAAASAQPASSLPPGPSAVSAAPEAGSAVGGGPDDGAGSSGPTGSDSSLT
jgi:hypothetical protein